MTRVIVLGAGRVGAAMALDLAGDPGLGVSVADSSRSALTDLSDRADAAGTPIRCFPLNLQDARSLGHVLEGHALAVGALPGPMGFRTLRHIIESGLHVVDISFFEEDPFELHELARRRGVVAIPDAGVAPGLSNLILGHLEATLARVHRFECLVGGIPADPVPPWEYRAPFSPIDVLAEYTRPARLRRDGAPVTVPALDELEELDWPGVGRLEAFVTDGLRTLLRTSRAPELMEKTLRWPGHAQRIRLLRDSGFLDTEPVEVNGQAVRPIDVSSALLFEAWRYQPGEEDLTVMRVVVDGDDDHGPVRHTYRLADRYHSETRQSAMARTTGYTATALARFVLAGRYREPGVSPPESVAATPGALDHVLTALRERNVSIDHAQERLQ
jgi:lysine 6-dehydrogenase